MIVENKRDHVTPAELADWIVQGRSDFRLLDLRDEVSCGAYHIPAVELVALGELGEYPLLRNEKIVLYSNGGIHAVQGWFLPPSDPTADETASFARASAVSEFFGGSPRAVADESGQPTAGPLPKVAAPMMPTVVNPKKKKAKEGC